MRPELDAQPVINRKEQTMSGLFNRRRMLIAAAAGAVVGTLLVSVAPSHATFKGQNGRLVFQAYIGARKQLFTINPDGTGARQITHLTDSDAAWPAWSPDGTRITFERGFENHAGIYTMNADGTNLRSLTPRGLNGEPTWSPDGKRITFGRYIPGKEASIWVMNADGSHLRRVTKNPLPKNDGCDGCAGQGSSVFSPDGRRIAFTWVKGEHSSAIFVVGVNGKGLHQVTPFTRGLADKIDWSPDGSEIGFTSPEFGRAGKAANVYVVRPDGTGLRQLTHERGDAVDAGLDSWSPNGTKIAYVSNKSGTFQIWTMNADGTEQTQLTTGPESHQAVWGTQP
jgi:Tol biopolymer transport system component